MENKGPRQYLPEISQQVQDLIYDRQKIGAIKILREETGKGLKESKEEIERIEAQLEQSYPACFSAKPKAAGCGAAALLLMATGIATFVLVRLQA